MLGLFVLILIGLFVFLAIASGPVVKIRVEHDEWTALENGVPTHGVGPRGYWTAHATFGGPFPFEQRPDGTWYNPKTGEDCVTCSLKELLEESSARKAKAQGEGSGTLDMAESERLSNPGAKAKAQGES